MVIPRRVVLFGAPVVAIALAVAIGVGHAHLGDVRIYRAGGRAVSSGGDLYALRIGGYGFTYPPVAAELFAVIAWLPAWAMFALLDGASALALYVVLRRSVAEPARGWRGLARVAPLALAYPSVSTFEWGQIDLLLAALVMHDLLVRRRGDLVGLAAALKLTPAVFVLYLLLRGRTREARTAVVTFVGAGVVGAVLAPAASLRYWTHDALAGSGVGGFDHVANQSVRGLAERAFGDGVGTGVWLVLAGPLLALGLVLARRVSRSGNEILAVGIVGVTACLVSPVSWSHHWVWCIPCLAALPAIARVVLAAVFANPVPLGHVVGLGYPIVAVLALAIGLRTTGRARSRPLVGVSTSPDIPEQRPARSIDQGREVTAGRL